MITNPIELRALTNDLTIAVWSLASIGVLLETGLADHLVEPRTIAELAAASPALPARRIEKVLNLAATHGVVVVDGARFRLAEGVAQVVKSPMKTSMMGEIRSHLMQPMAFLEAAKAGRSTSEWTHTDPALLQAQGDSSSVLPMMIKMNLAPNLGDLAARLERAGAKFLDIGTGVGSLAIAMCRVYPQIRVVGIDTFDTPLALARANIGKTNVSDRIELRKVGAHELRDEATFTCAWLPAFFIAPELLATVIERVAASLEPGGWLLTGITGSGDAKQRATWELVGDLWGGPTSEPTAIEALLRDAKLSNVRTLPGPVWAPQMIVGQR